MRVHNAVGYDDVAAMPKHETPGRTIVTLY